MGKSQTRLTIILEIAFLKSGGEPIETIIRNKSFILTRVFMIDALGLLIKSSFERRLLTLQRSFL